MKPFPPFAILFVLAAFILTPAASHAQTRIKTCVDELINWKDPWSLTPAKFREVGAALPNPDSKLQVLTKSDQNMTISASLGGKLTLFEGKLNIIRVESSFNRDRARMLTIVVGQPSQPATPSMASKLKDEITKATGDSAPKPGTGKTKYSLEWKGPSYTVLMDQLVDYKKNAMGFTP